jgi:MFS family permease
MGAALVAPSALSLLTALFPEGPQRIRAIALYTTVSAAGGATGLVAGGVLTQLLSWRWVMFVNVPIGLLVWAVGGVVLTETTRRHGRFDLTGAVTSTIGMTGVVLGLVEAGSQGWSRAITVVPLTVGAALLAVFVTNERRVEEPILPLRLLANATRTSANLARGLVYAGMYGAFFFLSQFMQDIQHYDPLRAGVAFLPWPSSVFLASQLTSRVLMPRLAQRTVMLAGIATAGAGLFVATRLSVGTGYPQLLASFVLIGAGMGTTFVALTTASLHDVEPGDTGAASGLINVSQQLGAALGLAVQVTVFGIVTGHLQLHGATPVDSGLVIRGLHDVFALGTMAAVAALLLVFTFVRRPRPVAELSFDDVVDPDFTDLDVLEWKRSA